MQTTGRRSGVRTGHHNGWLLIACCLALTACATNLKRPLTPFESRVIEVAPSAPYETCVPLQEGERLFFSYKADPPMAFSIQRRTSGATLSYLVRDLSREETGVFFVPMTENYCLHWDPPAEEVSWPTLLRFNVHLNPGS